MSRSARWPLPGRGIGIGVGVGGSQHGRRAVIGWSATALLLAATLVLTVQTQQRAASAQRAFGTLVTVWVATRDLEPGQQVGAADAETRRLPHALLADAAAASAVTGRTVVAATAAGEVILERRLAVGGTHGAAALLPAGMVALNIPAQLAPGFVGAGDDVVLIVVAHRINATGAPGGTMMQGRAVGHDPAREQLVVGVAAADAPTVAAALLQGELLVASLRAPTRSTG